MKRYDFPTPRLAFGLAAVGLTALTLATALVVPASLEPARDAAPLVANAAADESYRTEVIVTPTRIDVIAVRTSTTAAAPARDAPPKRRQQV
jgi:hypothetical protein